MLILSRKLRESIVIGDEIEITIVGIKGNQIRLGIEAPPDVSVHRSEVYVRVKRDEEPEVEDA